MTHRPLRSALAASLLGLALAAGLGSGAGAVLGAGVAAPAAQGGTHQAARAGVVEAIWGWPKTVSSAVSPTLSPTGSTARI